MGLNSQRKDNPESSFKKSIMHMGNTQPLGFLFGVAETEFRKYG
jgi:hypothetical protein